ncbi:cAMP-binding domain of CRP or a regulatory subunit of cAMP-dependent protein kinases [Limimaricola pyoseonensis]|uniref:cAMP-binding domain of CRP or a regulatory subunit of cAMP-dependent protein kinases n=2 Tax=Limimaricola pyoseonensis TaxID=521013 RepID=A0A1G7F013_9RHOB|nr:cAMP-binding domain of CRP or a regulatory subunit of cAMP-dependent protein kinases [Limimaricola pyoseonensis]
MDDGRLRQDARNWLLSGLDPASALALKADLEPVELPQGLEIEIPGEPLEHAYFPLTGVASMVAVSGDGSQQIEIGLVGCEGMTGLSLVLGDGRTPHRTVIQVPGHGLRIRAEALRAAIAQPELRDRLLGYAQAMSVQTAHTALANGKLKLDARLARWLLMCHDRSEGDEVALTHDFLSIMLGVRRAGVTVSLHILEGQGLLRATRGLIRILDRRGLEEMVGGFYGVPEAEYRRLVG